MRIVNDGDIARHVRAVDLLKVEILERTTHLFVESSHGRSDDAAATCAEIIALCYVLARRLGTPYDALEGLLIEKSRAVTAGDRALLETWYGDFTELSQHLTENR